MSDWMSPEPATLAGMIDSIDREVDAGMTKIIPWDVVRDGLRQRLGG